MNIDLYFIPMEISKYFLPLLFGLFSWHKYYIGMYKHSNTTHDNGYHWRFLLKKKLQSTYKMLFTR